jgi:lipopolysaccharide transport system ATP-binding protein
MKEHQMSRIAVKIQNVSKRYRIGLEEDIPDTLFGALKGWVKTPVKNFKRLRKLTRFSENGDVDDVLWALTDISFDVKEGEVIGIIGRNGAGKSTLLKILSKITEPTTGRIEIRGRVSSLLEVGTGFHPELTGRENVYLNGTILGMSKKEINRKFDEIVEFSGIKKFMDTPIKRYSTGMKVRLAFSVAAHLEPEILMIDEVLAVGDAEFQKKCLGKMENVGKQGRTVFFVSHNMPAISRLCERVILLDEGKIIADGPAKEIISNYLNAGVGTNAVRVWSDPEQTPGGKIARLRAVRVLTDEGELAETIDITKPISVEMDYEVLEPDFVLLPHFHFYNQEGTHLFPTIEQDPEWKRRPRPVGLYTSRVNIPGNFFAEGNVYVCPAMITSPHTEVQFREPEAVSFQIVDTLSGISARGDYTGRLDGVMRPLLQWKTEHKNVNDFSVL